MPKLGMEPIRRAALVKATIAEIGHSGSLDVTVSRIAGRAGMSPALAHHYFGSKEQMFLEAMRYILSVYSAEVRAALAASEGAKGRVQAIIRASFAPSSFRREAVSAWLNFYVLALRQDQARRLLNVYQRRLHSNLAHGLRPLVGARAPAVASGVAAMIDGVYLRSVLGTGVPDGESSSLLVESHLEAELERET